MVLGDAHLTNDHRDHLLGGVMELVPCILLDENGLGKELSQNMSMTLGVNAGKAMGEPIDALASLVEGVGSVWKRILAHPEQETRLTIAFGSCTGLQMSARSSFVSEDPLSILLVLEDRSQEAKLEDRLHDAQSNLEEFVYLVTHDLQNPVRGIRHNMDRMMGNIERGEAVQVHRIDRSNTLCAYLKDMIEGMMDYALSGGHLEDPCIVDLEDILMRVAQQCLDDENNPEVQLLLSEMPMVYGQVQQLERLFQNLLLNAWKYRREGERLILIASSRRDDENSYVTLSDNGRGFDPGLADDLFKPFFRAHGKGQEGIGIGLSTCRRIMDSHHGRVWAKSSGPDLGASFILEFPRKCWWT